MIFDPNAPDQRAPASALARYGPNVQAFVARHREFFVLVGVLVAQFLLLSFQITRNHNIRLIRVLAVTVFDPFERSLRGIANATTHGLRTYRQLVAAQQENQQLNAQLAAARSQIQQLSEQATEAPRLRKLLDLKDHLPLSTVAAEVIALSPGGSSNAVFIDKGADARLATDLAVITPDGVVGKTVAVFRHTSQVLLITDPASGIGAMLEHSHTQGILKGGDGNFCKLHYIMNEETVLVGETVVTSGLDQICPKGLPLGTVVQAGPGNIYKNITVKPATPLSRLENVLVVLKPVSTEQQGLNTGRNH